MEQYLKNIDLANKWSYAYYTLDKPEATDYEYDMLMKEIKKYEEENEFIHPMSPTLRIGDSVLTGFEKTTHIEKLYSLKDIFDVTELSEWVQKVKKEYPEVEFYSEPKYDGLSLNLLYEDGRLSIAGTRGDGSEGENVTKNIPYILGIPMTIPYKGKIEIRGEVVIFKEDFEQINKERVLAGKEEFANERNAASGSLKSYDSVAVKRSRLRFCPYGIGYHEIDFLKQTEIAEWIFSQGFIKWDANSINVFKFEEEIESLYQKMNSERNTFRMLLDGMVIKINQLYIQEGLGFTVKVPKWALAYKFPAVEKTTIIKNVVFQVGKTGAITPVAEIEPVDILGTIVSRATLHNFDEIKRKDFRIGDSVSIIKSGDVIPKILYSFKARRTGSEKMINEPSQCPCCGSQTEKAKLFDSTEDSAILKCTNKTCPAVVIAKLQSATDKKALDIKDLGDSTVEQLVNEGLVSTVKDFYSLKMEDLLKLEGFQKRKAEKLLAGVENTKGIDLSKFIKMLDIELIGERASVKISKALGFKAISSELTEADLLNVEDIGNAMATNYISFLKENIDEINILKDIIKPTFKEEKIEAHENFLGKSFVITGTLSKERDYFKKLIESKGGKISSSVSKKTDFVLVGSDAGSKEDKAKELGITILSEQDLENMI